MADAPAYITSDESCHQKSPSGRVDYVREEYKRYKRKKPPPDFSEVIDFRDPSTFRDRVEKFQLQTQGKCDKSDSNFGLRCVKEWQAYELKSCSGFIFIVNPFLHGAQHYWTRRCIEDFPRKPNVCNLDAHMTLDTRETVWRLSQRNNENNNLMDKLRWVHLGYHFDYNVVNYKPERYHNFPSDLAGLTKHIASAVGYSDYSPEAGIVNYYPLGGSMGGHTDHYESDLSWPLISLSFGQTAIFLIGGGTRDVRPVALYVRSGDIIIMSGKSRTAFHAVPRIIKVGKENEPPCCLKWEDGLFSRDVTSRNPDESGVLDDSSVIPGATNKDITITKTSCLNRTQRIEKPLFQKFGDDKIIRGLEEVGIDERGHSETDEGCRCDQPNFLAKSIETLTPEEWREFEIYLSKTRINVNVRQVHESGKTVSSSFKYENSIVSG